MFAWCSSLSFFFLLYIVHHLNLLVIERTSVRELAIILSFFVLHASALEAVFLSSTWRHIRLMKIYCWNIWKCNIHVFVLLKIKMIIMMMGFFFTWQLIDKMTDEQMMGAEADDIQFMRTVNEWIYLIDFND